MRSLPVKTAGLLTAIVWPCSSVFLVSSSLTLTSSFTMFSWPALRPAPFSTSLLRFDISSLSWLIVSFARTEESTKMRPS